MTSFIEGLAAGGKQWGEYAQGVETARTAPAMAQADLAKQQASAKILGQSAELGQYDVEAAKLLQQAATPTGPAQDYAGIYSQSTSLQQKMTLAKQKLAKAEELRNKTMASGKFSETTRKAYEDAQKEAGDLEKEYKTFQVESLRKVLAPALAAKDQSTYDYAKPQLAEAAKAAAMEEAVKRGEDPKFVEFIGEKAKQETLASLPKDWGPSAQNFISQKAAQLESIESSYKMDEQVRKEEEHKLDMKLKKAHIEKTRVEVDKLSREAKDGTPKATQDKIKELRQIINTESLELNRMTDDEERTAKARLDAATEAKGSWFGNKAEEDAEYIAAEKAYKDIQARKALAQKTLEHSQQELALSLGIAKEKGIEPPPEEPKSTVKMSDYSVTPELAAQGYTVEQVLKGLAEANPERSNEQLVQMAVEKGYFPKTAAKVVPEVDTRPARYKVAATRREQIKDALAEAAFGKLYSALSSIEQTKIDRDAKLKEQRELFSRK